MLLWDCSLCPWPVIESDQRLLHIGMLGSKTIYHQEKDISQKLEGNQTWLNWEPMTVFMLGDILSLGLATSGSGISSLMVQGKYYNNPWAAINIDIGMLENFIAHLQALLPSVAEVVLQNKCGLDLLTARWAMCSSWRRICFYVDDSGMIKESLAKVRDLLFWPLILSKFFSW